MRKKKKKVNDVQEKYPDMKDQKAAAEGEKSMVDTWSWGAFIFGYIWGIGHSVYISLLGLIPGVNIIMAFVLGIKGKRWAWERSRFQSEEAFCYAEESWDRVGFLFFFLIVAALVIAIGFLIGTEMRLFTI